MSKALATKKVAAVLLGLGMSLAFAGVASAQTTNASTLSTLQAQVQALLAQIASLQGTGTATTGGACFTFTQDEWQGLSGGQVMWVQEFLNGHGFTVAASGAGSPGNESTYFGALTKAAVMKFQSTEGISPVSGYWGPLSRAKANAICAGQIGTGTGTGTGTTPTGAGITVTSGSQPANSLAPVKATRVPFTTFTLTNNSGAAVTINGIAIQRTGLANDSSFAGVILLDSNGLQYGNAQTFNSNHMATIGGTLTMQAGQSMTFTVAGNMETTALGNAGQVASISVTGINTTVPVSGTLPITGASQTINESLTIGTASANTSGFDPNGSRSNAIGTTGVTFSAVRLTANTEDQKFYSITWNETGSAGSTDLSNLMTVVNGTSYPVTVDASGKYYTSTFPGGILVTKGNSVDVYIKGDITGSNASGRTVEFDIYRASDIYMVGQTYGYGILPTGPHAVACSAVGTIGTNCLDTATPHGSNFSFSAQPFFQGSTMTVTGGTLSTVSVASSVPPQNVGVNVPNQVLGGFTTNFTGEPVTVQSLTVHVASSTSGTSQLTNVTLVDQNGNVVAGPDDETLGTSGNNSGTIVFNSSITFPVGSMTYTIKGTVSTGATNGATYTLSTNPANDWSNAVGQTSGNNLTLTNTTITMSTMTVQPGQLNISASASPAAQTISLNSNNLTIANIVLDASQSGEDVRLNSLPIEINSTSTSDQTSATTLKNNITNCQLYNGSTVLNSNAIGSSQWGIVTNSGAGGNVIADEANFIFTNSLIVPKGTTVTLSLVCNVGGALFNGEQFSGGVSSNYLPAVTGSSSGNSITGSALNVVSGNSGTMTIGIASVSVTVPTPITYQLVAGGTTGVTVGTFTLLPTSGNISLQNIGLKLNSTFASPSDLNNGVVTIWNGSTQIGSVNFNGKSASGGFYTATSTISGATIQQNVSTTLTLKADMAAIGTGQSGTSGHEIRIALSDANGTSGSTQVDSGPGPAANTGVALFRGFPSVAPSGSSAGTLFATAGQTLLQFTISASSGANSNGIGLDQVGVNIATSSGSASNGTTTVSNVRVIGYDSTCSNPVAGYTSGILGTFNAGGGVPTATTTKITFSSPLEFTAGTTYCFKVLGDVSQVAGTSNTHGTIQTYLAGDSVDLAPNVSAATSLTSNYNMVWSPNSTTTSAASVVDWSNGFTIPGLVPTGVSAEVETLTN